MPPPPPKKMSQTKEALWSEAQEESVLPPLHRCKTQEPHSAAPLPKAPEKGLQAQEAPQRLPKDEEEEEEMRKAALSFPGPPGKSHLPGSPSPDHSTSPLEPARS
ncbi:hypothetical protein AB1E18_017585 [Capra hircus]